MAKPKTISEAIVELDKKSEATDMVSHVHDVGEPESSNTNADANRQSIIDMLTDLGIEVDSTKSTDRLTKDLQAHVMRLNKQIVKQETDLSKVRLKSIKDQTNLSDDNFILRLISLGVADVYLVAHRRNGQPFYLFSDSDDKLSDKQIWEKVRYSQINPIDTKSLFNKNIKRPERYKRSFGNGM